MKPYELLDHTADAKFRAYGRTREEVFANAVKAMTAIVVDPETIEKTKRHDIAVSADNLEKLLFDLLDEILFLLDTEKLLPAAAEHLKIHEENGTFTLSATLVGADARQHSGNLKAVTYSDMFVEEKDGRWTVQVVIDI